MAKGKKPNPFAKGGKGGKADAKNGKGKVCPDCKKPMDKCKCK